MTRTTITPQEAEELKELWAEYDDAILKAGAALGRYSIDPSAPERAFREDKRAGKAIKRIRQIYGD
jgi:hypothetical protein